MAVDINKLVENVAKEVLESTGQSVKLKSDKMTLALARQIIEKTKNKAAELGVKAVVAVADAGGNLVSMDSMDDAYIASLDIALNKAFTSVSLKMSTAELSNLAAPSGSLYGIQFTNNGRIVIFGGGEPLRIGENVIGGVGVSGGTAEEDTFLGEFARKTFEELIK